MSELSVNTALSPELHNATGNGAPMPGLTADGAGTRAPAAPARLRPDAGSSPGPDAPSRPFADLLAGVLQGAQPPAPASAIPAPPGTSPGPDPAAESGIDPAELLALAPATGPPPNALEPLRAPVTGTVAGNVLPPTGNALPADREPAGRATRVSRAISPDAPPPAGQRGVSLADLDWARAPAPLPGSAPGSAADTGPAAGTPKGSAGAAVVLALAGRSPATARHPVGDPAAADPGRAAPALFQGLAPAQALGAGQATAPAPAPGPDSPAAPGADQIAQLPGGGAAFAGRPLAAFAVGTEAGTRLATDGLGGTGGTGGPATSGTTLPGGLGSTSLPALQPLGHPSAFSAGLADRLLMLGGPGTHSARLKLYPEHLGELKVEIRMDDGTAEVRFATSSPQARDAIEGTLPRLRELFAEQGIQLTRAQVDAGTSQPGHPGADQQGPAPWNHSPRGDYGWRDAAGSGSLTRPLPAAAMPTGADRRLLDVWA